MDFVNNYEFQFVTAYRLIESNPDEAIRLFENLRKKSDNDSQYRWALKSEFWILQTLMYIKQDYKTAHQRVIEDVLWVKKPKYSPFPEALAMQLELLAVYEAIDPVGYADEILTGLDYLQGKLQNNDDGAFSLPNKRVNVLTTLGKLDEAQLESAKYLNLVANEPYNRDYYSAISYIQQSEIAYLQQDWHSLKNHVIAGRKHIVWAEQTYQEALLYAWSALSYQMMGDIGLAQKDYLMATTLTLQQAHRVPHRSYYRALGAYLEASHQYETALKLFDQHFQQLQQSGRTYWACWAGIRRIEWLKQLSKPYHDDEKLIRKLAEELRSKDTILKMLDGAISS